MTGTRPKKSREALPDLEDARWYFNRELSWLEFDRRVLDEARDPRNPLLERIKFLSIFWSNLDEFFMIRVSGLRRQLKSTVSNLPADGMSAADQLGKIAETLGPMLEQAGEVSQALLAELATHEIHVLSYDKLGPRRRALLRRHFEAEIFPALTPLAFDPSHPFPHISNLSLNLGVVVRDPIEGEEQFARIKVPPVYPRLLRIPTEEIAAQLADLGQSQPQLQGTQFVWIEDIITHNLDLLFPGMEIVASWVFRITRDADYEIEEDEAADLLETLEELVSQRHFGFSVRLEVALGMPTKVRETLAKNLKLAPEQTFTVEGPLGLSDLMQLYKLERPELRDPPYVPYVPPSLNAESSQAFFAAIRERDVLLYHPYDSFMPVVDFIRMAAADPDVVAIKQTLYRVGKDSPIVKALMEAREDGKQVAVLVELKARFDEENNIVWARALERAGVHVVYGVLGLKTHAKMSLVVRREKGGMQRYVHIGTGNYNPATARIYTDLGYLTCDPEIAADVSDLFNRITGYARKSEYRKLLVAPESMRRQILLRIEREIARHRESGNGRLIFKLNALVDKACIQALYRASHAGVAIDLQVRGICCLRPGLPGVSENIRVTSIVGRFLEHSRIFYFRNGGEEEILLGSADLMPRNLDGRVETLCPIVDAKVRQAVRDEILFPHLSDTRNTCSLGADGRFERVLPKPGEEAFSSQGRMMEHQGLWSAG